MNFGMGKRVLVSGGLAGMLPLLLGASGMVPSDGSIIGQLAPYIGTGITALGAYGLTLLGRLLANRKRAKAEFLDEQARLEETDKDPTNDLHAKQLRLQAKMERADAEVLDDPSKKSQF